MKRYMKNTKKIDPTMRSQIQKKNLLCKVLVMYYFMR